tara:strand:+ start:21 stop:350 length:330 start_codon:yes stop_codon:yes gene_type:complete
LYWGLEGSTVFYKFKGHSVLTVNSERYLNHPTFGMLYLVAPAGEGRDVYATLYAQKMFFLVTLQSRGAQFEVIPYLDARHHAKNHLARCRRENLSELKSWQDLFHQTFM